MAAALRCLHGPAFGWPAGLHAELSLLSAGWPARTDRRLPAARLSIALQRLVALLLEVSLQRLIALGLHAELFRLSAGWRPASSRRRPTGSPDRRLSAGLGIALEGLIALLLEVPLQWLIALWLHAKLFLLSAGRRTTSARRWRATSDRRLPAGLSVALQRLIAIRPAELSLRSTGSPSSAHAGGRLSAGLGIPLQRLIDLGLVADFRPAWGRPSGAGRRSPLVLEIGWRSFGRWLIALRGRAFLHGLAGRRIDRLGKDDHTLARSREGAIRRHARLWNRNGRKQHRAGKQRVAHVLVHLDPCEKA
jgi:hypothetical protein